MSKVKDIAQDLCDGEAWNREWALKSLLTEDEMVISRNSLNVATKHVEFQLKEAQAGRSKDVVLVLKAIQEDLNLILISSQP